VLRRRLELLLFLAASSLCRVLPPGAVRGLGAGFGRLLYRVDGRHRELALANYRRAFPQATEEEARRVVLGSFAFFGRYVFEGLSYLPRFPQDDLDRFEHVGFEHLQRALLPGRGALAFTGHFGGWELQALVAGAKGLPVAVLSRPLDNPYLETRLRTLRGSTGNAVIDKRDGFRGMLRALREGRLVAILIDQNVTSDERIFVDFFGVPASTTPVLGLIHRKTGAPLLPVFAYPLEDGRWRMEYGPVMEVETTGDRDADVLRITQACTRVIEERIRAHPHLWLWMHNRWKTRPS
jgi:KDO2-lipid IV(A) lauroyltransferase